MNLMAVIIQLPVSARFIIQEKFTSAERSFKFESNFPFADVERLIHIYIMVFGRKFSLIKLIIREHKTSFLVRLMSG